MNRGYGIGNTLVTGGLAVSGLTPGDMWVDGSAAITVLYDTYARVVFDLSTMSMQITDNADVDKIDINYNWIITSQLYTVPATVSPDPFSGPIITLDTATFGGTVVLPIINDGDTYVIKDVGDNASVNPILVIGQFVYSAVNGFTNSTTTFIDPGAAWITNGVLPKMWVNIPSGPAAGSYQIVSVDAENTITLATTAPTDSSLTYTISWGVEDAYSFTLNTNSDWRNVTFFPGYGWYFI